MWKQGRSARRSVGLLLVLAALTGLTVYTDVVVVHRWLRTNTGVVVGVVAASGGTRSVDTGEGYTARPDGLRARQDFGGANSDGLIGGEAIPTEAKTTASSTTSTWADTAQGQVCHQMFPWELRGEYLSYGISWNRIRPALLNASYYPPQFANVTKFRHWVSHLFDYYTHERLQRSQAHPAPRESIRQLWKVIERRVADPENNEPVRIAVFGGSVTAGRACQQNPIVGPHGKAAEDKTRAWCAYPHLLNVMLDRTLFPHRSERDRTHHPVFEVTNMAVQATNSEVGAMAIEYNLLPALETSPPHVVVSSYSVNDALDVDENTFWTHQQSFVKAAHSIRPCHDHLPLVVLADDFLGQGMRLTAGLINTGSLYKTAAWHNVMAIMYSNVVRASVIYHANFTDQDRHPIFGSSRWSQAHLGFGFHVAQGWTLFFNLVGALHDACSDVVDDVPPPSPPFFDDINNNSSLTNFPNLAPSLPTKYMGRYNWDGREVLREWDENARIKANLCKHDGMGTANDERDAPPAEEGKDDENEVGGRRRRSPYGTARCEYAWMVNPMTSVWFGEDVQEAIDAVLVDQRGWHVTDRTPKSGWQTTNATNTRTGDPGGDGDGVKPYFTIELRNLSQPVDTFTLMSLKSYGSDWVGSRLDLRIVLITGTTNSSSREESTETTVVQGSVGGHHDKDVSVLYPHRFRFSDGTAALSGDTLRATFTLGGGTNFKISGLAFCRSWTTGT